MTTFEIALQWIELGIAVIPCWFKTKYPALNSWYEFQTRLPTVQELKSWFTMNRNIAVITGWRGLVVIDFDVMSAYDTFLQISPTSKLFQNTYTVKTARGVHSYFFVQQSVKNSHIGKIDIKAAGGFVIAPPSIHPSGSRYSVSKENSIQSVEKLTDILPVEMQLTENTPSYSTPYNDDDPYSMAGRYNPETDMIRQIKDRISILDYFYDAHPTRNGWYVAKCPFHDDSSPSFWIDTNRGLCGCYSGCTPKPMDVIDLHARLHGLSNRDAIIELFGHI